MICVHVIGLSFNFIIFIGSPSVAAVDEHLLNIQVSVDEVVVPPYTGFKVVDSAHLSGFVHHIVLAYLDALVDGVLNPSP